MKIPVLVSYQIRLLVANGRRGSVRTVNEIVEMEITSKTANEAPIAVTWDDMPDPVQEKDWGAYDNSAPGHTRWFADKHWRPLLDMRPEVGSGPGRPPVDVITLDAIAMSDTPYQPYLGNMGWASASPKVRIEDCPPDVLEAVVDGQRDQAIADCKKALDRLLVIEGTVYQACIEPKAVIIRDRLGKSAPFIRNTTDERDVDTVMEDEPDNVVPLTRFERLCDLWRLFDRTGMSAINQRRRPEILIPESIDEDAYLLESANVKVRRFLSEQGGITLDAATLGQLKAVVAIREAISIHDTEDMFDALGPAAAACAEHWPEYERRDELLTLVSDMSDREMSIQMDAVPERGFRP